MKPKRYSSYAEIDRDLEILKLEREIHYKKIILSLDKTKESILPSEPLSKIYSVISGFLSGWKGTVLKLLVPYTINWFMNKKRGD